MAGKGTAIESRNLSSFSYSLVRPQFVGLGKTDWLRMLVSFLLYCYKRPNYSWLLDQVQSSPHVRMVGTRSSPLHCEVHRTFK